MGSFRLMEEHAGLLNKRYPGTKRSIKFNDVSLDRCIDIKLLDEEEWKKFTFEQIKKASLVTARQRSSKWMDGPAKSRKKILMSTAGGQLVPVVDNSEEEAGDM